MKRPEVGNRSKVSVDETWKWIEHLEAKAVKERHKLNRQIARVVVLKEWIYRALQYHDQQPGPNPTATGMARIIRGEEP